MGLAWMYAGLSKDPNTQVGSVIISGENSPLGFGYNGPPAYIDDNSFDWARPTPNDPPDKVTKYDLVIHAEANAINRCRFKYLGDSTLYVTGFPCTTCMKTIIDAGISRIVYMDYPSSGGMMKDTNDQKKARKVAEMAGVRIVKFKGKIDWLKDWVSTLLKKGVFDL